MTRERSMALFFAAGAAFFLIGPFPGWWEPSINLLGCVLFGVAAVAGHVVPATGSMLDQAAANWTTSLGAACFLACALATLLTGRTLKSPRLRRLRKLERVAKREAERIAI